VPNKARHQVMLRKDARANSLDETKREKEIPIHGNVQPIIRLLGNQYFRNSQGYSMGMPFDAVL